MGCGCGGKKATRTASSGVTVARTSQSNTRVETAQTFQSATIKRAPTGPVGVRKTV